MSRLATPRPPGEHLTILARIVRQIGLDKKMTGDRRRKILAHLSVAMNELQAEIGK
jgi:hypothetical protein